MGFKRDKTKDSQGFRGLIPDNTTLPVVLIEDQGTKFTKMKKGDNAGKTAKIFKPVFETILGTYAGGRVYSDIWLNVEKDDVSGEAVIFGSHMLFCDLCDATGVMNETEDGEDYPVPSNQNEADGIMGKMIGKPMMLTVGVRKWEYKGKTGESNTIKSIVPMTEDQLKAVVTPIREIMERVRVQQAKKAAKAGGSGLEGFDTTVSAQDDYIDGDMPF